MRNFADLWESYAGTDPDGIALIQGERELTWSEFDREAGAVASGLLDAGLGRQSKVGCLLYNSVEYMTVCFAAFKAALVPVNVNYRYSPREAAYLLADADAEAVVFHSSLAELVEAIRPELPGVRTWIAVDDGRSVPGWAADYAAVAAGPIAEPPWERSEDDLVILYTGGTTGMPKGVMWAQGDLVTGLGVVMGGASPESTSSPASPTPPLRLLPASPLMHAAGLLSALGTLSQHGCLITVAAHRPRAEDFWDAVSRHRATTMAMVGDAFARPLAEALDAEPDRWDLSGLTAILSSGVAWSETAKRALLAHLPQVALVDLLGSSEAIGMGRSETTLSNVVASGHFRPSDSVRLIDAEGRVRRPAPGVRGLLAMSGIGPLGYYKDPEKSASTFMTIDGVRYSVPGDFGEVAADGGLRLLGRGSGCINTGGEKIFPEEVDEVLKLHPFVLDAACIGLADERFGEVVCAVVEAAPSSEPDLTEIRAHTMKYLADFKAPRRLVVVDSIDRSAAGKLNYPALRRRAMERLGAPS
ncbi:acyl-CoA synthetase [Actinomadura luteofluorescens]|uniref:AMP-binding protein n=1 Tax=Actinomadura luteofluorescens TaxID=46163 RepID=UPI0021648564|nr:AMP-binding protein [Actinomadura glauciflava]MCR3745032.1 Acyl-CoA synthetase (AMP-forming)/AMP-acid ligase II [Actinomadura glauciflava]